MTTAQQPRIDAVRRAPRRLAVIGLLAWVSTTAAVAYPAAPAEAPSAVAATEADPASPAASTELKNQSEQNCALKATAWNLRNEQPVLFGGAAGVLVLEVESGSQAAALGLRPGDILLRYGGQPLNAPDRLGAAKK